MIYEDVVEVSMLSVNLTSNDVLYQIDLSVTSNCDSDCTELLLKVVSEEGVATVINRAIGMNRVENLATFTTVCVGGSLLEAKNYIGKMQRVFVNYNALLEEQNLCRLEARSEQRSDVISFSDSNEERDFMIERYTLSSAKIAFQVRFKLENRGSIFLIESGNYSLNIFSFNENGLAVLQLRGAHPLTLNFDDLTDDEWHQFEISAILNQTEGGESEICIRYDGIDMKFRDADAVAALWNAPLQFAHSRSPIFEMESMSAFSGCMRKFEFKQTAESEIFRPNLEELPRLNPVSFSVDDCFNCLTKTPSVACSSGEVCLDPGFEEVAVCSCPQGYEGPTCQGK